MKSPQARQIWLTSNLIGFFLMVKIFFIEACYLLIDYRGVSRYSRSFAEILISLTSSLLPCALLVFVIKKKIKDVAGLKLPQKNYILYIGLGLGIKLVAAFCTNFVTDLLASNNLKSGTPEVLFEFEPTVLGIIFYFFSSAVVPALGEEFMCRGVILGVLRPFGARFSIVVSALIFGLMHGNIEQFILTFLMGLYFGFLTVKTESILPAIILHFLNNFSVWLFVVFSSLQNPTVVLIYHVAVMLVAIVSFMLLFTKKDNCVFAVNTSDFMAVTSVSALKKFLNFLIAPGMVVFLIYAAFVFCMSFR